MSSDDTSATVAIASNASPLAAAVAVAPAAKAATAPARTAEVSRTEMSPTGSLGDTAPGTYASYPLQALGGASYGGTPLVTVNAAQVAQLAAIAAAQVERAAKAEARARDLRELEADSEVGLSHKDADEVHYLLQLYVR